MVGISKLCSIVTKEELHALVDDMFNQFSEVKAKRVLSMSRAKNICYSINWVDSRRRWTYYTQLYDKISNHE